mmetsp:Transcript_40307/g.114067  ORF Transcript_40307/g.114067 Transcript_40307/m.114067 type:complete len:334 (-) Transcript_40307:11-1012(-)
MRCACASAGRYFERGIVPTAESLDVEPLALDVGEHGPGHQALDDVQRRRADPAEARGAPHAFPELRRGQVALDEGQALGHLQPLQPRAELLQPRRILHRPGDLVARPHHDEEVELPEKLVARHDDFLLLRVPLLPGEVLRGPVRDVRVGLQPVRADDEAEVHTGVLGAERGQQVVGVQGLGLRQLDVADLDGEVRGEGGVHGELAHDVAVQRRRLELRLVGPEAAGDEPDLVGLPAVHDLGGGREVGVGDGVVGAAVDGDPPAPRSLADAAPRLARGRDNGPLRRRLAEKGPLLPEAQGGGGRRAAGHAPQGARAAQGSEPRGEHDCCRESRP